MAGLHAPLSMLRRTPHGMLRMTRGRRGSLHLHRNGLAPSTPCRSPGALHKFPFREVSPVHGRGTPAWEGSLNRKAVRSPPSTASPSASANEQRSFPRRVPGAKVYGLVFSLTRSELDRLYSESSVQAYKLTRGKPNTDVASCQPQSRHRKTVQSEKEEPDLSRLRPKPVKSTKRPGCYQSSRRVDAPCRPSRSEAHSPGILLLRHARPHLYYPSPWSATLRLATSVLGSALHLPLDCF
jgi:hypothetical protein